MYAKTDWKNMKMQQAKQKRLREAGWKVADASEFLELTNDEKDFIEMKLALGEALRAKRREKRISQVKLAALIDSSQSRVAKMEAADASVSLDLLVKSLLALGATRKELAKALTTATHSA